MEKHLFNNIIINLYLTRERERERGVLFVIMDFDNSRYQKDLRET